MEVLIIWAVFAVCGGLMVSRIEKLEQHIKRLDHRVDSAGCSCGPEQ